MRRWLEDKILAVWQYKGLLSTLLLPLSYVYGFFAKRDLRKKAKNAWQAPVPVIVIGNILVGGTGKTPVSIAICQALQKSGWRPGIVSRGYGVHIKEQAHLSADSIASDYLGDEPSLLHEATKVPVAVHPNRSLAAKALLSRHPEIDVLISDDGLQHLALKRDIEIIVQDQRGIGNGRLIPAGPLREPADRLNHADYIINNTTGNSGADANGLKNNQSSIKNVFMYLKPSHVKHLSTDTVTTWDEWLIANKDKAFNAIAGIGQPARFFQMLELFGIRLANCLSVADHQKIGTKLLVSLDENDILITAKDAVKCAKPYDPRLKVVYAQTVFSDEIWLTDMLVKLSLIKESKK